MKEETVSIAEVVTVEDSYFGSVHAGYADMQSFVLQSYSPLVNTKVKESRCVLLFGVEGILLNLIGHLQPNPGV